MATATTCSWVLQYGSRVRNKKVKDFLSSLSPPHSDTAGAAAPFPQQGQDAGIVTTGRSGMRPNHLDHFVNRRPISVLVCAEPYRKRLVAISTTARHRAGAVVNRESSSYRVIRDSTRLLDLVNSQHSSCAQAAGVDGFRERGTAFLGEGFACEPESCAIAISPDIPWYLSQLPNEGRLGIGLTACPWWREVVRLRHEAKRSYQVTSSKPTQLIIETVDCRRGATTTPPIEVYSHTGSTTGFQTKKPLPRRKPS